MLCASYVYLREISFLLIWFCIWMWVAWASESDVLVGCFIFVCSECELTEYWLFLLFIRYYCWGAKVTLKIKLPPERRVLFSFGLFEMKMTHVVLDWRVNFVRLMFDHFQKSMIWKKGTFLCLFLFSLFLCESLSLSPPLSYFLSHSLSLSLSFFCFFLALVAVCLNN